MGKPNYRVVVSFDPARSVFTARAPELEHLTGEGPSRKDAIAKLEEEIDAQLANMLSHGSQPPSAVDEIEHTGEVSAKVSKTLHRDLAYLARSEGVELDQIVSELLASALTMRQQGRRSLKGGGAQAVVSDDIGNRHEAPRHNNADGNRSDGNRRFGGGRGGNNPLLDDRAHFIEYVRGLENNPAGAGHQRHAGNPRHEGRHDNGAGGGGNNRRRRGGRGPQPGQHGQHGQHQHNRQQDGQRQHSRPPASNPAANLPPAMQSPGAPPQAAAPSPSQSGTLDSQE